MYSLRTTFSRGLFLYGLLGKNISFACKVILFVCWLVFLKQSNINKKNKNKEKYICNKVYMWFYRVYNIYYLALQRKILPTVV